MLPYQLYVTTWPRRANLRLNIAADSDSQVTRLAQALFDACADVCCEMEIWRGLRAIWCASTDHPNAAIQVPGWRLQQQVAKTEIALRYKYAKTARSKQFRARPERLKWHS
jgi:hypothetical protein